MKKIKKTIFTLNVDGYAPEITELTYPLLRHYANKIDASFHIINKRKFPDFPPVYEKLQIYELAQKMKNDWNIYIDSDALVHPDMFDPTNHIKKDTVMHNGVDMASIRWSYDNYFLRDGRNIGSCDWFTIASDWCIDLWTPLDVSFDEAIKNIHPIQEELSTVITPEHLIDDYTLSRNIAKFGLKIKTVSDLLVELGNPGSFLWHQYTMTADRKVSEMRKVLANWGVSDYKEPQPKIEGWMDYSELIWLYLTAQKMDSVAEIGSYKGRSAHALASGCRGRVYLIDNFEGISLGVPRESSDVERELRANMANFKNVEVIKLSSKEAASHFRDKSLDMVFLDGSHDRQAVYEDIIAWYPKCKKLLCGHDFDLDSVKFAISDADLIPVGEVGKIWSVDKTKPRAA